MIVGEHLDEILNFEFGFEFFFQRKTHVDDNYFVFRLHTTNFFRITIISDNNSQYHDDEWFFVRGIFHFFRNNFDLDFNGVVVCRSSLVTYDRNNNGNSKLTTYFSHFQFPQYLGNWQSKCFGQFGWHGDPRK